MYRFKTNHSSQSPAHTQTPQQAVDERSNQYARWKNVKHSVAALRGPDVLQRILVLEEAKSYLEDDPQGQTVILHIANPAARCSSRRTARVAYIRLGNAPTRRAGIFVRRSGEIKFGARFPVS